MKYCSKIFKLEKLKNNGTKKLILFGLSEIKFRIYCCETNSKTFMK